MVSAINNTNQIVSGKGFCPVCGQKKSWSYLCGDNPSRPSFAICYGSSPATPGWKYCGQSASGGGKYLREGDKLAPLPPPITSKTLSEPNLAPIETIDKVYRAFLARHSVKRNHWRQTRRRELTEEELERAKKGPLGSLPGYKDRYKTIQLMCDRGEINEEDLAGVPGFYINDFGSWTFAGPPGLLLPFTNENNQIEGLQIRPDDPIDDSKYIWFSSNNRKGGTKIQAPAGVFFPPNWEHGQPIERVLITEGYFKALVLSQVESVPVVYLSGVGMIPSAIRRVRALGSPRKITLVFDSDFREKLSVRQSMVSLATALKFHHPGYLTEVTAIGWDSKYGKGIDDAIRKGGMKYNKELFEQFDLNIDLERIEKSLESDKKGSHLQIDTQKILTWQPRSKISQEQVREETFDASLKAFESEAGTFFFVTSGTGGGKTHICIHKAPKRTIFVFGTYKKLMEEYEKLQQQGKNAKIFYGRQEQPCPPDPVGGTEQQWNEYQAQQRRFEAAGCLRYEQASQAGSSNHNPCEGCKFFEYHHKPLLNPNPEEACRYWPHREALEANLPDYLLMMPQSLLHHSHLIEPYQYVVIDDIPNFDLLLCNKISLTPRDLQLWLKHPQKFELSEPIIRFIELLKASIEFPSKRGWTYENLKEFSIEALEALRKKEKGKKKERISPCERPFEQEEEVIYPHKRLEQLLETIALGRPYHLTQTSIEWLAPHKEAIEQLKQKVTLYLDATPRLSYWLQTLPALGFKVEAPELPRIFPKIVQICDRLYSKEQIDKMRPFLQLLIAALGPEETALFSFQDTFEGQHGHFGRDERGLNQFSAQGFRQMIIAGHHQMSEADSLNYAWCLRAFAAHMGIPSPIATFQEGEEADKQGRVWRRYSDPLRSIKRKSYRSNDPFAEELRRHHNTSSILQLASRLRNAGLTIFVFSGEPLDGLHYEIPCQTLFESEIAAQYNLPLPDEKKALNQALLKRNEKQQQKLEIRLAEGFELAKKWAEQNGRNPSQNELRILLAEEGKERASYEVSRIVKNRLEKEGPWSDFEEAIELEAQGEEEDIEIIGQGCPTLGLKLNNIKGAGQGTPDLSFSFPSEALETQAEQPASKVTTPPDLLPSSEPLSFSSSDGEGREPERDKKEAESIALMLKFHLLMLPLLLHLPPPHLKGRGMGRKKRERREGQALVAWRAWWFLRQHRSQEGWRSKRGFWDLGSFGGLLPLWLVSSKGATARGRRRRGAGRGRDVLNVWPRGDPGRYAGVMNLWSPIRVTLCEISAKLKHHITDTIRPTARRLSCGPQKPRPPPAIEHKWAQVPSPLDCKRSVTVARTVQLVANSSDCHFSSTTDIKNLTGFASSEPSSCNSWVL